MGKLTSSAKTSRGRDPGRRSSTSPQLTSEPTPESPRKQAQRARRQRRVERFEQVHERRRQRQSVRQIARDLGMSRCSVRRYLRCETCPDWNPGRARRSRLDAHREWIDARLAEGNTNAVELHRQLRERGFRGSYGSVRRYVTKRLGAAGKKRERINAAEARPVPPPSAKQLSFEWVRRVENRKPAEQARLDAIRAGSEELEAALNLADEFANLIRKRSNETLTDWLARAEVSSSPELRQFAESIRRDESAVSAAMTESWSNGPVVGHVEPAEDDQTSDVRSRGVQLVEGEGRPRRFRLTREVNRWSCWSWTDRFIESAGEPVLSAC